MDKRTKVAVCVAAAHNLLSMMAVIIASRKRKRNARSAQITYAPLHVSGTGWDEDNFVITLDEEHYNGYVKDDKSDADCLNKPFEHFDEMQTIFGNTMATCKFAKDSSAGLGEDDETENEEVTARAFTKRQFACDDNVATSSASKSNKKAKKRDSEEELIAAFKSVADKLSNAIEKVATWDTDVPDDLFDNLLNLPGFEQTHISLYFNYLVAHPHIARAFNKLPFDHKLIWARNFVSEKFLGV